MIQMATTNYYNEERQLYKEAYGLTVSNKKGIKILRKLSNHYETLCPTVRFWGHRDSGSAGSSNLRLSHHPSVGLIMHEFAHFAKSAILQKEGAYGMQNQGTSHHGTRFQAALNFVNQYAQSKGYWRNMKEIEVKIKEEKKEQIDEPLTNHLKQIQDKNDDIARIEAKIKRYEKRLQYFQKLYTTKIKKARRSIAAHKRVQNKLVNEPVDRPLSEMAV
jgi:hypothetical protein